jgi:hypothetical protein
MSAGLYTGPMRGGLPNSNIPASSADPIPTLTNSTIPPGAQAPVWQPWVNSQTQAQGALKTAIDKAMITWNRQMLAAQAVFDGAAAIAAAQSRQLEEAAWASWNKYMAQAAMVYSGIMDPANTAYRSAVDNAHATLTAVLKPSEDVFASASADTHQAHHLANVSDTME